MAANLTAVFELIDRMSDKLDRIANAGDEAIDQWDRAESAADAAFGTAETGGQRVAQACDEVATAARNAGDAMEDTADATDYWTDAVGNYDKSALEAIYTTEELVEMGFKTQDALEAEAAAAEEAEDALDGLEEQSEDTGDAQEEMEKKGVDAASGIASALTAAGITKLLKEAAEAAYELAEAFDEAEGVIVRATGATGDALDGLSASMLDVYATVDDADMSNTAAAIGEINTRLGLTGDELTRETKLFMDFADITGTNVVKSVQNVTQLMRRWNVDAEDSGLLLDKLAYAAQASGISVDSLTSQVSSNKAVLDALGFSLDETIAMFSQFELEGINTTSVMTGFRTALTSGTIESLEDLYDIFDQISRGEISAADAADIFGTKAGAEIVSAVNQGALSLDDFIAQLEACEGTCEKTEKAADTMSDKWTEAGNTMKAAVSSAISPTITSISGTFADMANGVATFLKDHPAVTKALTAVAVGLGVAAAGVVAVSVASLTAIPAVAALGTAINAAIWPITLIAAGVAAVTAAVLLLSDAFKDETDGMTASTREQYYAIQDLSAEYENACATYGETSEEASRLRYELDDLNASFEANRQTVEEFTAEVDGLIESHQQLVQSYEEGMTAINQEEVGTFALIQKLEDLATANDKTAASEEQMKALIDQLNKDLPGLSLNYDDVTSSTTAWVDALKSAAEAQAEQERQAERQQAYVDLLKEQAVLEEEIAKAEANLNAELERTGYYWDEAMQQYTNGTVYEDGLWSKWTTDVSTYHQALDDLNATYADNQRLMSEIEQEWNDQAEAAQEAEEATVSYEDAVATALESVQDEIDELCAAYDQAYESARNSIDSQIGLFQSMATETETSVADMQAAFQSQLEYLALYTENLHKAAEYGLDEGLIASLSDGSEESAGYINEIISHIEELGSTSEEAQAFVDDFNSSFQEVEQAKDEFATTVAQMETDFDAKMAEIEGRLDEAIDNMNMEADAAAAAKATMSAYTQAIIDGTASAVSAAEAAASAVAAALSSTPSVSVAAGVPGHATGTTDAEDAFVAGEDGPELIVGAQGSTVFPADETRKIINAVDNERGRETYVPPGLYGAGGDTGRNDDSGTTKKVLLEIAGKGNIELTGGKMDKETMLAFLYEYLKPVLSEILTQEIFEEGDGSYEY